MMTELPTITLRFHCKDIVDSRAGANGLTLTVALSLTDLVSLLGDAQALYVSACHTILRQARETLEVAQKKPARKLHVASKT